MKIKPSISIGNHFCISLDDGPAMCAITFSAVEVHRGIDESVCLVAGKHHKATLSFTDPAPFWVKVRELNIPVVYISSAKEGTNLEKVA